MIATLRELGVLKAKEQPRVLHQYACPFKTALCTCTGGPEIMWPDYDELRPIRHYISPERFNVVH